MEPSIHTTVIWIMLLFYQLQWGCERICTCACACVYANGFRLHLKTTNYLKLIASNAFLYVRNAIEIGNVGVSERASDMENRKDMCISHTTLKAILHFVYGFSESYMSFFSFESSVVNCAISIESRLEMYCRIRAPIHTMILKMIKHTIPTCICMYYTRYGIVNDRKKNT